MTNNIDRAAEVILRNNVRQYPFSGPSGTAQALADAGLLAPDLPEPYVFASGEREWSSLDGWVNLDTDGTITIVYDERDEDDIAAGAEIDPGELVFTRISEAEILARAFLAATIYAQKEETNE